MSPQTPPTDSLLDLLQKGAAFLEKHGIEHARLETERLISATLSLSRVQLYLQYDRPCTEDEKTTLREQLMRRAKGEPLQYILGYADFYNQRLTVRRSVLIPRPETELIIELARQRMPAGGFRNGIDIGCGSGALAVTLLTEDIVQRMVAVDVFPEAIALTRENAEALNLSKDRLRVVQADALQGDFSAFESDGGADLVVSNPPYVSEAEYAQLPREIREHEPRGALVSGADGLDAHRALTQQLPKWLQAGGLFLGEIGAGQGEPALRLHRQWAQQVLLAQDLAGRDRVVIAEKV